MSFFSNPKAKILVVSLGVSLVVAAVSHLNKVPEKVWEVNKKVSERFTYVPDLTMWGEDDYWDTSVTGDEKFSGDCEEYAIAAKRQLRDRGIESKIWFVYTKEGIGHAVTCTLDDWCIDSWSLPKRKKDTNYRFIEERFSDL